MKSKAVFGPRVIIRLKCAYAQVKPFFTELTLRYFAVERGSDPVLLKEHIRKKVEEAVARDSLPDFSGWGDVTRMSWRWENFLAPPITVVMYPNRPIERAYADDPDPAKQYIFSLQQQAILAFLQGLDERGIKYEIVKNGD